MSRVIRFADVEGRTRRVVLVQVEGRDDFGIATGIELRLRAFVDGVRLLPSELGAFDCDGHGWYFLVVGLIWCANTNVKSGRW